MMDIFQNVIGLLTLVGFVYGVWEWQEKGRFALALITLVGLLSFVADVQVGRIVDAITEAVE